LPLITRFFAGANSINGIALSHLVPIRRSPFKCQPRKEAATGKPERSVVEFGIGVGVGEYEGVVRASRRVFQILLSDAITPDRCLEAYHLPPDPVRTHHREKGSAAAVDGRRQRRDHRSRSERPRRTMQATLISRRFARPHFSASGLEFTELDQAVAPLPPPRSNCNWPTADALASPFGKSNRGFTTRTTRGELLSVPCDPEGRESRINSAHR
jgi:hypothetical protein